MLIVTQTNNRFSYFHSFFYNQFNKYLYKSFLSFHNIIYLFVPRKNHKTQTD